MSLPAILGGTPMRPQGPPAWPPSDPELRAVFDDAWREGWWGKYQAGQSEMLETKLREYHGIDHVLLCGSGNYAVELGLRALKIGPGDEVILSDYDYPGNFLSIHAIGATPVLVDIDARTWNLSQEAMRDAVGPATRAILASHLHGGRVPMRRLMEFAREKGLAVVEDAAQAAGATIDSRRAGTWGDVGILSFGGSKILSAGRGGALMTRDPAIAQRARNHLTRAGNIVCPMSEMQAALVVPQLERLDERTASRWHNVQILMETMADIPGVRLFVDAHEEPLPAFYKLGIQLDEAAFGLHRSKVVVALRAEGYAVDEGFAASHFVRSPKRFRAGSSLSMAERAHAGCVQLHHPILLEPSPWVRDFAEAWRRIYAHVELIEKAG